MCDSSSHVAWHHAIQRGVLQTGRIPSGHGFSTARISEANSGCTLHHNFLPCGQEAHVQGIVGPQHVSHWGCTLRAVPEQGA